MPIKDFLAVKRIVQSNPFIIGTSLRIKQSRGVTAKLRFSASATSFTSAGSLFNPLTIVSLHNHSRSAFSETSSHFGAAHSPPLRRIKVNISQPRAIIWAFTSQCDTRIYSNGRECAINLNKENSPQLRGHAGNISDEFKQFRWKIYFCTISHSYNVGAFHKITNWAKQILDQKAIHSDNRPVFDCTSRVYGSTHNKYIAKQF